MSAPKVTADSSGLYHSERRSLHGYPAHHRLRLIPMTGLLPDRRSQRLIDRLSIHQGGADGLPQRLPDRWIDIQGRRQVFERVSVDALHGRINSCE